MLLEPGMLARSKAGRDKDHIYVIISIEKEYVYLADGQKRPVSCAKKKNQKHIQAICGGRSSSVTDNEIIRNTVREFLAESRQEL